MPILEAEQTERVDIGCDAKDERLGLLSSEFESLYSTVYNYLLHRLFDRELAEELTAETLYRAAANHIRIRADGRAIRVWLLRTATNLVNAHFRRLRLRRLFLGRFGRGCSLAEATESARASSDANRSARVRAAVRALRPKYQAVVVLRYFAQMPFAEISSIVGCRPDAVRARLSRAIRELRDRLRREERASSSIQSLRES